MGKRIREGNEIMMLSTIGTLEKIVAAKTKIDAQKSCFYGQKITKKVTLKKKKKKKKE
jgi:hypothetical protein